MIKAQTSQLFIIISWNMVEIYPYLASFSLSSCLVPVDLLFHHFTTQFISLLIANYRIHSHYLQIYFNY